MFTFFSCRGRSPRKPDRDVEDSRAMSSDEQNSSSNSASLSGRDGGPSINTNVGASGGIPPLMGDYQLIYYNTIHLLGSIVAYVQHIDLKFHY